MYVQLNIRCHCVSQYNKTQLLKIPLRIQILVMRQVESATGKHQRMQMHVSRKSSWPREGWQGFCRYVVVVGEETKQGWEIGRSEWFMTFVGQLSKVKLPTTAKWRKTKFLPEGRGGGETRAMEGKSTGIVEKGLEMRRVVLGTVVPYYITVVNQRQDVDLK